MNGPRRGAAPPPRCGGGGDPGLDPGEPEGAQAAALAAPPEDAGNPAYVTVRSPKGESLAKLGSVSV